MGVEMTFDRIMARICREVEHTVGTDGKPLRLIRDGDASFGTMGAVRSGDLIPARRLRYDRTAHAVSFGRVITIDYSRSPDEAEAAVVVVARYLTDEIRLRDVRVAEEASTE